MEYIILKQERKPNHEERLHLVDFLTMNIINIQYRNIAATFEPAVFLD